MVMFIQVPGFPGRVTLSVVLMYMCIEDVMAFVYYQDPTFISSLTDINVIMYDNWLFTWSDDADFPVMPSIFLTHLKIDASFLTN